MNLFTVLGVLFIALKLMKFITWSWWLVLAPIYGGALLVFGIIILATLFPAFFITRK